MTGKTLAKKLGFPDAPSGYHWKNIKGKLTLSANPKNTSTMINTKVFNENIYKFSKFEYAKNIINKKLINKKSGKLITGIEFISKFDKNDIKIIEKFDNLKNVELKWINEAVNNSSDRNYIITASNTIQKQIKNNTLINQKVFTNKRTKTYNLYLDKNNIFGKKGKKLSKELSGSSQKDFIKKMCKETGFSDDIFNTKVFNEKSNPLQKNGWKVTPGEWIYYNNGQKVIGDYQIQLKFEHKDGTLIRYKPKGDFKRKCTYSIEIEIKPMSDHIGPDNTAFKLDNKGIPVPLGPNDYEFKGTMIKSGSNIPQNILKDDKLCRYYSDMLADLAHIELNTK